MLLSLLLLPIAHLTPLPAEDSLLSTVPAGAYALMHCRDVGALRARTERNDWVRLLASSHGEPFLNELQHEIYRATHSDMDELLEMAEALEGEAVFFDTGVVAGFVAEPSADREVLAELVRNWLPQGESAERRSFEHDGGAVEIAAWPAEIDGWSGRAGHYAAFVDHPLALAIYSGDDSTAVMAAVKDGIAGLGVERRAPLVASYLKSGGGKGNGVELFVDFTPFIDEAERTLKDAVDGLLPDPTRLLGLERGTWLHASADVFPGTTIDCSARLHIPADTLAARLADTFVPLPHTLPADLPKDIWALWTLNWDLKVFYQRVREAYEEAGLGEGLGMVDAGIDAAKGLADVDPVVDMLNRFAGDFAVYLVNTPLDGDERSSSEMETLLSLGIHAGLTDGTAFLAALEKLIDFGDLESTFEWEELAGVEAFVSFDDADFDGGFAVLPRAFSAAPSRRILERGLLALTRAQGASLSHGSLMQATLDEHAGVCFLSCMELTPLRAALLPDLEGELLLPPLEEGQPSSDPFDSQLIYSAKRVDDGFELRLHTR